MGEPQLDRAHLREGEQNKEGEFEFATSRRKAPVITSRSNLQGTRREEDCLDLLLMVDNDGTVLSFTDVGEFSSFAPQCSGFHFKLN